MEQEARQLEKSINDANQIIGEKDVKISQLLKELSHFASVQLSLDKLSDYVADIGKCASIQYHPVPRDSIDQQLSHLFNTQPSLRARLLFLRESEGVYSYCRRKVLMKSEEGRLIIRVGGGFMSLEHFLD